MPNKPIIIRELDNIKARLMAGDLSSSEIGREFNRATSHIAHIRNMIKDGSYDQYRERVKAREEGGVVKKGPRGPYKKHKKIQSNKEEMARVAKKVFALREKGLTIHAIARKLGVSPSKVGYHLYQTKEQSNGHAKLPTVATETDSASLTNRNIKIGIAYAETERFLGLLSERLSLSADVLRSRLSELL